MPSLRPVTIEATDIPDAWFQAVYNVLDCGSRYEIQHGSFVGQTRLEFDWAAIFIKRPYREPYDLMLPSIPAHLGIPDPVEPRYVEQYLPYLMDAHKEPTEQYTYGERIRRVPLPAAEVPLDQVEHFIRVLKSTPHTNQAILQVARPEDALLSDPPCLRHVDMRIKDGGLIFYPYFRSWDLWAGFPANLAGLAVLQKYMADEIGVTSGPMICASKGLHLYGYVEELARLRAAKSGRD